jgi:hypothetical protein
MAQRFLEPYVYPFASRPMSIYWDLAYALLPAGFFEICAFLRAA